MDYFSLQNVYISAKIALILLEGSMAEHVTRVIWTSGPLFSGQVRLRLETDAREVVASDVPFQGLQESITRIRDAALPSGLAQLALDTTPPRSATIELKKARLFSSPDRAGVSLWNAKEGAPKEARRVVEELRQSIHLEPGIGHRPSPQVMAQWERRHLPHLGAAENRNRFYERDEPEGLDPQAIAEGVQQILLISAALIVGLAAVGGLAIWGIYKWSQS